MIIAELQAYTKVAETKYEAWDLFRGQGEIAKIMDVYASEVIELAVKTEGKALYAKNETLTNAALLAIARINQEICSIQIGRAHV